jgi:hypothetical protein
LDLELPATAYLLGNPVECRRSLLRAHRFYVTSGSPPPARCAFWVAFTPAALGGWRRPGGWLVRAHGQLERWSGNARGTACCCVRLSSRLA